MKLAVRTIPIVLLVTVAVVLAHDPLFWKRYLLALGHSSDNLPLYVYGPRERITGGNQPAPPRESPDAERLTIATLEAAADYAGKHRSRALIVTRHGYIVFERYWRGGDLNTLVESDGLGRVVAALTVGIAISDRLLGWPDEPVGLLLDQWRDDPRGAISVRNLLQLSSGLVPPRPSVNPWSEAAQEAYGQDLVGTYLRRPLGSPPGSRWVVQNADSDLLALVIERAAKKRYADYVSEVLWRRIGAGDAWLWLDRSGGAPHVDRGFLARQGDWMRIAEVLISNGRYQGDEVLSPRWMPVLLEPAKSNADYGASLRLGAHAGTGASAYSASDLFLVESRGNHLWLIPSLQMAILRTGQASADWDDTRIPNLICSGARDFVPAAARPGGDVSGIVPHH